VSPTVALYVSGHGFGHAVRCAEVAAALLERGSQVLVRTDAPDWLFPHGVSYQRGAPIDVGVAQHDGLELDIDATRCRWAEFALTFEAQADEEASLLKATGAEFVLGDVPPLAFLAAARAGLPSAAVTNFGWDWIYAAWDGFEDIIARIQASYRLADVLYRLPLHSPEEDAFPAFKNVEAVPLIARTARRSRDAVRSELGVPHSASVVLLSFGGFQAAGLDLASFGALTDHTFVVTSARNGALPSNILSLPDQPADYVSLLAACDAVITKPGYGIVADCLANRVPMLFTDRGPFREYDVLAEALSTLGRARYVPRADVLEGRLAAHLAALEALPDVWTDQPMNGAQVIADRLVRALGERAETGNVIENLA
jgi:L-arabinokinase